MDSTPEKHTRNGVRAMRGNRTVAERRTLGIRNFSIETSQAQYDKLIKLSHHFGISRVQVLRPLIEFLFDEINSKSDQQTLANVTCLISTLANSKLTARLLPVDKLLYGTRSRPRNTDNSVAQAPIPANSEAPNGR